MLTPDIFNKDNRRRWFVQNPVFLIFSVRQFKVSFVSFFALYKNRKIPIFNRVSSVKKGLDKKVKNLVNSAYKQQRRCGH